MGDLLTYACHGPKGDIVTDGRYEPYEPPTIGVIGSVEELTQTKPKYLSNVSDGFTLNGRTLSLS